METEEAKLETWTDSASMYGSKSKSKCQSSWVNNTERTRAKVSVLGGWILTDSKWCMAVNQDNIFMRDKKATFIESYLSSHK